MNTNNKTSIHNQYLSSMQESLGGHIDRHLELNPTISDEQLEVKEYSDNNHCFEGDVVDVEDIGNDEDEDDLGNDDDQTNNPQGSESTGRWTRLEHALFLEALKKYGKV